jgi:hypothetical protein
MRFAKVLFRTIIYLFARWGAISTIIALVFLSGCAAIQTNHETPFVNRVKLPGLGDPPGYGPIRKTVPMQTDYYYAIRFGGLGDGGTTE